MDGGGGVGVGVSIEDSSNILKEGEGKLNEMIVTRHNQFLTPINIVSSYGEQECRVRAVDVEEN